MYGEADREQVTALLRETGKATLPGHMGLELVEITDGAAVMTCDIQPHHLSPNGFLHAGSVVTLADTAAGFGCVGNMPEGATSFTTIELKTNFLGTLLEGVMVARATMVHSGRTTQVWDVEVSAEATGKTLALFRATQMILYPSS